MNKITPSLLLAAMLAISGAAAQQPAATPVAVVSAAQTAAAKRLVQALGWPQMTRYQMTHTATDQETTELMQYLNLHTSDDELSEIYAPAYAAYGTPAQLDELAKSYNTSLGRQLIQAEMARAGLAGGPKTLLLSAEDQARVRAIEQLPAKRAINAARAQISAEIVQALQRWVAANSQKLIMQAMSQVATLRSAVASRKMDDPEPKFNYQRTGMPILDHTAVVVAEHQIMINNASASMQRDMKSYGLEHVLEPGRLLTPEGIAQDKATMAKSDDRIERYLRAMDGLQSIYRDKLAALPLSPKSRSIMDGLIGKEYEMLVKLGENQRAQSDQLSRIIAFAESRQGKFKLEQNRFIFDDASDLEMYNTLMQQRGQLVKEENQLLHPQQQQPAT